MFINLLNGTETDLQANTRIPQPILTQKHVRIHYMGGKTRFWNKILGHDHHEIENVSNSLPEMETQNASQISKRDLTWSGGKSHPPFDTEHICFHFSTSVFVLENDGKCERCFSSGTLPSILKPSETNIDAQAIMDSYGFISPGSTVHFYFFLRLRFSRQRVQEIGPETSKAIENHGVMKKKLIHDGGKWHHTKNLYREPRDTQGRWPKMW